MEYNDPFYFAVPDAAPLAERNKVPAHIKDAFGFRGPITFVRREPGFILYRITA